MIENLRKYTGLIIVLFVLVIIGFIFMDTSAMRQQGGGSPYLKVAGRSYTDKEFRTLGSSSYELAQGLAQAGDFDLYSFLFTLTGNPQSQEQAEENFFSNRIILQKAKEEFGIYPGEDEISSRIRQLRAFTGPDGGFSQDRYRDFVEKGIGRLGLTEKDIRSLISDVIAQQKLTEILGSGLTTPSAMIERQGLLQGQQIAAKLAMIPIEPIEKSIEVSEDEVRTYWETVRDAFKTPEKRKFSYFTAEPQLPSELPAIADLAEDADDAAKAAYEEAVNSRNAENAETKRLARLAADEKVDDFLFQLETRKNADFNKLATEAGWTVKTTELLSPQELPEDLKTSLRASSSEGTVADELFQQTVTDDPFSKLSPAFAIGENQWLVAKIDGIEASRTMTFDEAKNDASARLLAEKSRTALREKAQESMEKMKAAIADGKTFSEAALAADIQTPITTLSEITSSFQPDPETAPEGLFKSLQYVSPGEIADPIIERERAFIALVESREVIKSEEITKAIETQIENSAERNQIAIFSSWLAARAEASDIQQLYRQ